MEYHRLGELGIFKPDERIELIRGDSGRKYPDDNKKNSHSVYNVLLVRTLTILLGELAIVRQTSWLMNRRFFSLAVTSAIAYNNSLLT